MRWQRSRHPENSASCSASTASSALRSVSASSPATSSSSHEANRRS